MGVAKGLFEKCNKSSSLIFDELFEETNRKPNYLLGFPLMVDTTPLMLPRRTLPYLLGLNDFDVTGTVMSVQRRSLLSIVEKVDYEHRIFVALAEDKA